MTHEVSDRHTAHTLRRCATSHSLPSFRRARGMSAARTRFQLTPDCVRGRATNAACTARGAAEAQACFCFLDKTGCASEKSKQASFFSRLARFFSRLALTLQKISMKKPELEGVKNLLFDLGGVIMDIRRENCVKALEQLEVSGIGEMLGVYCQQGAFLQLEEGKITPAEFRDYVRGKSARTLSDEEIDTAFDAFLVGIPVARLHALESLRNHYKIYVLSNTNAIMYNQGIRREFEKDGKHREDYFDGICTSFEEGVAKPDRRIFEAVVRKFGIRPEETLFFDDSQTNLDAASQLGFKTWLVAEGTEFMEAFGE